MDIETRGSRGNVGYARFRQALLEGRLQPGSTLTQAELCEILGMSLSPMRDTLTLLEADDLVKVRHRAGISIISPDLAFIRRNFQFRTMIEQDAIVRFVETVGDDWIAATMQAHDDALKQVTARTKAPELELILRALDWEFHSTIVTALRNDMIAETHFLLQENLKLVRVVNDDLASPSKVAEALTEHRTILMRLRERDADGAVSALHAHFRAAIHRAFGGS